MKKSTLLTLALCLFSLASFAADFIVESTGIGGAYTSIGDAVAASSAGDRILIYEGASSYQGNFTISHSLELMPAEEGDQPLFTGSISIASAPVGSEISISGLRMLSGGISAATAGLTTTVNVMRCELVAGSVNFDTTGYIVNVANCTLDAGAVYIRNGKVVGNTIATTGALVSIYVNNDAAAAASDTPVYIVGNVIDGTTSGGSTFYGAIQFTSSRFYAVICNNIITVNRNYSPSIYVTLSKTGPGVNRIENNTAIQNGNNTWGIYTINSSSEMLIRNNVIQNALFGIGQTASANVFVNYNEIEASTTPLQSTVIDDGTNNVTAANTLNADGSLQAGSTGIDAGYPSGEYTDLDLTANDAGCYGGSFSKANFDAANASTGATTWFMIAPRRILAGQTIDISAEGSDQ